MKKILFINADVADYLGISILHGLKSLSDVEVTDYPISEILYKENKSKLQSKIRGKGFTLFFLLDKDKKELNRFHIFYNELINNYYDLIIFSDINTHFGLFLQYLPYLRKNKTIILDGSDSASIFPYSGHFWRKPYYRFLPRANKRFKYYKREITPETIWYRWFKLVPKIVCKYLPLPSNVYPVSFSIPEEKIVKALPIKTKLFPKHIVDEEIANKVEGSFTNYVFENETEYYSDLQSSKFGITTKRAGWDCMRHYEIAANGAVICFKDLNNKSSTCAPHGLRPGVNCLSYSNYDNLMNQIADISEERYKEIQKASLYWIRNNSTIKRAKELLETFNSEINN